jgi:hypothetical protein
MIFVLTFYTGGAGVYISFPIMLTLFFVWKFLFDRNDVCPWCNKAFSYSWYEGGRSQARRSGAAEKYCANCEQPKESGIKSKPGSEDETI